MSLKTDLKKVAELDGRVWLDCARACVELAFARTRLASHPPEELLDLCGQPTSAVVSPSASQSALIDRVAFAVPRMGARVPWRSSCLVQALAAQRWLARNGIATRLVLGARKPEGGDMEAHAWLKAGERIVVGGDPGDYQEFRPVRRP